MEHALEELQVTLVAALLAIDLEHAPRRPRVHRRIHVAERPLVGGHLPVRMHVPLARQQHELLLRELCIDQCERQRVERQIPRRVPRVFPLVRHRDDVGVVQMIPLPVAAVLALRRRRNLRLVAFQPLGYVEIEELLAPDHSGERLPLHQLAIGVAQVGLDAGEELVGLANARGADRIEVRERSLVRRLRQSRADLNGGAAGHVESIPRSGFGAGERGIHCVHAVADHTFVKCVFDVAGVGNAVEPVSVRLVVGEKKSGPIVDVPVVIPRLLVMHFDVRILQPHARPRSAVAPGPGIAKAQLRQDVQRCDLGAAIVNRDAHQHVVDMRLRVLDEHIEVAVLIEHPCVGQLVFWLGARAALAFLHEQGIRIRALRILVEHLQVRVRRRRVEVVVELLHVLAMIAFAVRQAEQALLEDRVAAVPQRQRQDAARDRRSRPCRPRPSGRRGCARDRAESSPTRRRSRCSPRARCPTAAR